MTAESFKQIYMPLYRRLYRQAIYLLGNAQDAEDLVQETYYKLWTIRNKLEEISSAEAFAITIIKNLANDKRRHKAPQTTIVDKDFDSGNTADYTILKEESENRLDTLLNNMSENQRTVLLMKNVEEKTDIEIEKATGLSSTNIRQLLSRARKYIRDRYDKD